MEVLVEPTPGTTWVYPECTLMAPEARIRTAFQNEKVIAVSDSSYKNGSATASWVLATSDGTRLVAGSLRTPGDTGDLSALRSELSGIYAVVLTLERLTSHFHIDKTEFEIGCDNKGALTRSFSADNVLPSQPNYDLIQP